MQVLYLFFFTILIICSMLATTRYWRKFLKNQGDLVRTILIHNTIFFIFILITFMMYEDKLEIVKRVLMYLSLNIAVFDVQYFFFRVSKDVLKTIIPARLLVITIYISVISALVFGTTAIVNYDTGYAVIPYIVIAAIATFMENFSFSHSKNKSKKKHTNKMLPHEK